MTSTEAQSRLALKVTIGSQASISFVPAIAAVMAPQVAPLLGLSPDRVGVFSAITYLSAMICGLIAAPWITWLGPVRATQIMLLTAAVGAALATLGSVTGLIMSAAVIGASMGCPNPALSAILGKHAPTASLNLFLSLRQAAAPIGIALAGLVIPMAEAHLGWQGAIWAATTACAGVGFAVGQTVRTLDWRAGERPASGDLLSSLAMVVRRPALRRMGLVSMAFGMAQQGFLAYSVLLLIQRGMTLRMAAGLLAISQAASVIARIGLSLIMDQRLAPRRLLAAYGVAIALTFGALGALPSMPSPWLAGSAMAIAGATAIGWQSLLYAQLLRIVPRDEVTRCASGTQFFTFAGAMLGPYLMATLFAHGATYTLAFVCLGGLTAAAGASLWAHRPSVAAEQAGAAAARDSS